MTRFLAAVVQMRSGEDKEANLSSAIRWVERAAQRGAKLIALPELFNCLCQPQVMVANAEAIPGPTSEAMSALAARLHVTLLAGSIAERSADPGRVFNTSLLFGPDGIELGRYRKIHLFDIDLPGQVTHKESQWFAPGEEVVHVETPLGRLGMTVCYDLRFAELYRRLADVPIDILLVPAAFTLATGRDHWEALLRARAIENQAYVIAPDQWGQQPPSIPTFGHSMIVDPWGTVTATVPDGEGVAVAEIDHARIAQVRKSLPALEHRRLATDCTIPSPMVD
jgi:predicted amidohydrolase